MEGLDGVVDTRGTGVAKGVLTRRLAALAMRFATEERAGRGDGEAALRLGALVAGVFAEVALAAAVADRLRPLRLDEDAFAFAPGAALAFGLGLLTGLAFALARVVRALGAVVGCSRASPAAGVAEAAAERRRAVAGAAALALAAGRALRVGVDAGAFVERVR